MGLYSEGLTIRRIFASEMHGGGGGGLIFFGQGALFLEGLIFFFFFGGGGGGAYRNFTVCQLLRFLKITGGIYTCTFSIIFDFFGEYLLSLQLGKYSKHPHIRTYDLGFRLIKFLFTGCLVRNQPENVLKISKNTLHYTLLEVFKLTYNVLLLTLNNKLH